MILLSRVAKIIFLSLSIPISLMAQTASDLRAKYGPPSEIYEIKPSISLTVKYGQDGQVCEMLITERNDSHSESADKRSAPDATASDLLEQLAPNAQRGLKVNSTSTVGNCFALRAELYENVLINRYENSCGSAFGVNKTVQILWRNRQCKTRETIIDTEVTRPPAGTGVVTPTFSNREMPEIRSAGPCGTPGDGDHIEYKRIYRKYEISQSAELLLLPQPELTPEAIAHKTTGKMIIEATLGPCGEVSNIVMRGHVPFGLTERAIAATRKIKFKPAAENGLPVAQRVYLEYEFYLCRKAPICSRVSEIVQ